MDQDLFENIGPQSAALLLGDAAQGPLAGGSQHGLAQLTADGFGVHQILGDGPGAGGQLDERPRGTVKEDKDEKQD